MANEVSLRLQKDLDEANQRLSKAEDGKTPTGKKKAPMLGSIGKNSSTDGVSKYNRKTGLLNDYICFQEESFSGIAY